ncbi:MAG: hypothetical protein AAF517_22865 [Planctomycetota bacterium]
MRSFWMTALLLTISTPLLAGGGGKMPFVKDVEKGMQMAKMSGKPMMLYFTADW